MKGEAMGMGTCGATENEIPTRTDAAESADTMCRGQKPLESGRISTTC